MHQLRRTFTKVKFAPVQKVLYRCWLIGCRRTEKSLHVPFNCTESGARGGIVWIEIDCLLWATVPLMVSAAAAPYTSRASGVPHYLVNNAQPRTALCPEMVHFVFACTRQRQGIDWYEKRPHRMEWAQEPTEQNDLCFLSSSCRHRLLRGRKCTGDEWLFHEGNWILTRNAIKYSNSWNSYRVISGIGSGWCSKHIVIRMLASGLSCKAKSFWYHWKALPHYCSRRLELSRITNVEARATILRWGQGWGRIYIFSNIIW